MKCGTELGTSTNAPDNPTTTVSSDATESIASDWTGAYVSSSDAAFQPGFVLGRRYEIAGLLGEGGMGAVYKAVDLDLDRTVALKVIRPKFAQEPSGLARFKRELVLARQVTHRNVIRIFDLGAADGYRFITMEYVDGTDLSSVLRQRKKLPPAEVVVLIRQILLGLQAAHDESVIHRDLKPSNIMIDGRGRAIILDFGIARAAAGGTLTHAGAIVGTPVYMSPEQAKGNPLDARSDLYSLGIIFYELLTGKPPFLSDNVMTMLLKRCQEDPTPPADVDPSIPAALNNVVLKALARDPDQRYQNAQELLHDLDRYEKVAPPPAARRPSVPFILLAMFAIVLSVLLVYIVLRPGVVPTAQKPVAVLVADFDNTTSEAVFDGTLEPVFIAGLEGAPFIQTFSRPTAHTIALELSPQSSKLNEVMARLIAKREGINAVLTGLIARQGDGYRITVNVIDGATGKTIVTRDSPETGKNDILREASNMVPNLRRALGDVTPENQMAAAGETFTASSLDAVHHYGAAQQLQWEGKFNEAATLYLDAVKADPKFGRAYSGLAAINANLGRRAEAEKYYKLALAQLDRMSEREKLRTLGSYFVVIRDNQKAIEESRALVKQFPFDTAGAANLAFAYCEARDMVNASIEGRKAVELLPKNTIRRNNLAFYNLYAGNSATAIREAQTVISQNPHYSKAYLITGMAQILDGHSDKAIEAFRQLEKSSALGPAYAAVGLADMALYQGRFSDAVSLLEAQPSGVSSNTVNDLAASSLLIRAEALVAQGNALQASQLAEKAVETDESDATLVLSARVLELAHKEDKAHSLAETLAQRVAPEPRAWAKVISGELLLSQGKSMASLQDFREAEKLTDVWLAHLDMARAYLQAGAFAQATSELDLCLKRRGEATSVFIEDYFPTIRYLPAVYYYSGRAKEGLRSMKAAAESYRAFLAIKEKSQADPLVDDARRRFAALLRK